MYKSVKLETAVVSFAVACWIGLTVAAGLAEKTMSLTGRDAPRSVYSDSGAGTAFNWLDLSRKKFSCLFLQNGGTRFCGMDFQLGDGFIEGWDLTSYDRLQLDLEYRGAAEQFRIFFRSYEPGLSQPSDAMYHFIQVPLRNGIHRYDIPLDNFEVADWWLANNKLTETGGVHQPRRDNVVHIGFDIQTPVPVGKHHFNVVSLSVVAPRIGKSEAAWWALGSIAYFSIIGGIYHYLRLRTRVKQHQDEMFGLLKKLDEVGSESSRFKRLSMYDPLTGLLNRRAAQDLVEGFAQQYSLHGTALIMMDIDHFKAINDTYGHDFGDEVLRRVSEVIRDSLREGDAAVRWGGEEMVIICPKTSSEGAYRVAEKLRSEIKALGFSTGAVIITASFGVANIRQNESFSQALGRADEALYEAKRTGRDRVC
jgi:diguanylate cyclase (GGDEF)-like protein